MLAEEFWIPEYQEFKKFHKNLNSNNVKFCKMYFTLIKEIYFFSDLSF